MRYVKGSQGWLNPLSGDAVPSFARVSEADMRAMYAYFMHGVAPVAEANRDSDIPWPLSMRWPLAFWRGIFAPTPADFVANPQVDPVLERGRYLVEGLGHCGACHTPRSLTMQEKRLAKARVTTIWRAAMRRLTAGSLPACAAKIATAWAHGAKPNWRSS